MAFWSRNKNPKGLRIIKTARDEKSINKAVKNGFRAIVLKVEPSLEIRSKFSVIQNKKTGEVETIGDYRTSNNEEFETVIDWTFYYPYSFKSPFAAYLIPKDIKVGERVYVEDLIEDYIGASWNQGDAYRLESCEAIWNGENLEILYDESNNRSNFMG